MNQSETIVTSLNLFHVSYQLQPWDIPNELSEYQSDMLMNTHDFNSYTLGTHCIASLKLIRVL